MEEIREANVVLTDDNPIPTNSPAPTSSYSMLEPRMKKVYGAFYKELYFTPERRVLDSKTQELISIAASLQRLPPTIATGRCDAASIALTSADVALSTAVCAVGDGGTSAAVHGSSNTSSGNPIITGPGRPEHAAVQARLMTSTAWSG